MSSTASKLRSSIKGVAPRPNPLPPKPTQIAESQVQPRKPASKALLGSLVSPRWWSVLTPILIVAIWECLSRLGIADQRFFPPPTAVLGEALDMIREGELQSNIGVSLRRIFFGFVLGAVPGVVLGLCMGMLRPARMVLEPIISATLPIPKSALMPLLFLIFGLGEQSKVLFISIGVFFPVVIATEQGVRGVSRIYFDVAKDLDASRLRVFATVGLPGALPSMFSGFQLALGSAFIFGTLVEMLGARSGLGFVIWNGWQLFQVERMYVGIVTVSILGLVFGGLLRVIEARLVPWQGH